MSEGNRQPELEALSMLLQPVIRTPASGVLLMGLLMVGHSLAFPSAGALLSRNTPPERQGSTMGLMMASNAVGRILAPPLFGLIYDEVGHDAPWYAGAAMIGLVVLVALQAVPQAGIVGRVWDSMMLMFNKKK